jgi:hypothetical protein
MSTRALPGAGFFALSKREGDSYEQPEELSDRIELIGLHTLKRVPKIPLS